MQKGLTKKGKRLMAMLLTGVILLSFSACTPQQPGGVNVADKTSSVKTVREPEPPALQIANAATTLALRQYIFARLKTEAFVTADFKSMPVSDLKTIVDQALAAWDNVTALSSGAVGLADRAQLILEAPGTQGASKDLQSGERYKTLSAKADGKTLQLAESVAGQQMDPKTWADNFTKQFDAIKGNQKIKQLAQQLGQDAKSVHEQLEMAQSILRNEATADAAFWDKMTKAAQATKTACKVALFVGSVVATGGGSLSALGASSLSLGQAGAVIVSGTDCIVEVAATGSNIILGENHQVTMSMNDLKDKLSPVSSVIGLLTFNAGETGEQLSYIGDSLTEWFYDGKIMGIKLTPDDKGGSVEEVQPIAVPEKEADLVPAIQNAGFEAPQKSSMDITELTKEFENGAEQAIATLNDLISQMDRVAPEATNSSAGGTDNAGEQPSASSERPAESNEGQPPAATNINADVTGTYNFAGTIEAYGDVDDLTPCTASIKREGPGMVITINNTSGTVLTGTYDEGTATFTGIDTNKPESAFEVTMWQLANTTIRFSESNGSVTAEGLLQTGNIELVNTSSTIKFTLAKTS